MAGKHSLLLLFLCAAPPAPGQIFFEDYFKDLVRPKQSMTAAIRFTYVAHTPWGVVRQVETAQYWRSGKGLIRQDDAYGLSTILDLRGERSRTMLDYELKVIERTVDDKKPNLRVRYAPGGGDKMANGRYTTGMSRADGLKKIRKDSIEGLEVTVRRKEENGVLTEAWVSDKLKLILRYIVRTPTEEIEQVFYNIRLEEPDPSVFELPEGFRIHTQYRQPLPSMPCEYAVRVTNGVTGEDEALNESEIINRLHSGACTWSALERR